MGSSSEMTIQLKVGDEIYTGHVRGRGGHGAFVIIEKINAKSIVGKERERSYHPGTKWKIGVGSRIAKVTYDGSRIDAEKGLITGLRRDHWGELEDNGKLWRMI